MKLPEAVVTERDSTIFEMRKQGLTYRQIGRALQISESTAYRGCKRISDKIISKLAIDHGQEILLDLQRIDGMIASFLPQTRVKKIETPDGDEVEIPPNIDAANMVLKLMTHRAKLLGLEQGSGTEINITQNVANMPVINTSVESEAVEKTPEEEAKHLFNVFKEAGVIDDDAFNNLIGATAVVIDAEVVDETQFSDEIEELEAIEAAPLEEPPEFMEGDDG